MSGAGEPSVDLDEIGVRCDKCGRQDYLPITCERCKGAFCHEHREAGSGHVCAVSSRTPQGGFVADCPICGQPVAIGPRENPHYVLSRHIDAGCPKRKRQNAKCSLESCSVRDAVSTTCKSCGLRFCLQHRLEIDHECRAKAAPPQSTPSGSRPKSTPARVKAQSLNLSVTNSPETAIASANVGKENRFPLVVYFPVGSGIAPRHMYFNKRNSVGRVLDLIEDKVPALKELNGGERLSLFAVKMGRSVNRLPHMSILEELGRQVLSHDDAVIVEREETLPIAWKSAFGPQATAQASLEKSRRRVGSGGRGCRVQ